MGNVSEKSIPRSLHECGWYGVAQAVTFLACWDIAKDAKEKLQRGEDPHDVRNGSNCMSAIRFLMRKENHLYTLDIPGEELIETIIRRTTDDWKRNNR